MIRPCHDETEANATTTSTASSSLLDEIVRDGARPMLAAALQVRAGAFENGKLVERPDESGGEAQVA